MKDLIFFPLGYFVLVATLGLVMRLMPYFNAMPFEFENVRHSHSHIAFLGWVCSGYLLLIFQNFFSDNSLFLKRIRPVFIAAQVFAIALGVTFFLSGYSASSIVLLSIHSILLYGLIFYVLHHLKNVEVVFVTRLFLVSALFFFCLSTFAPFCMPILIALNMYTLENKNLLVQTFLHFQIHGWFVFGLLALVLRDYNLKKKDFYASRFKLIYVLLVIGVLSTFLFTIITIKDNSRSLHLIGRIGSIFQLIGYILFFYPHHKILKVNGNKNDVFYKGISAAVLLVLVLKSGFEILRGFNNILPINLGNHLFVIAFLHLVLLGAVSIFIIDRLRLGFDLSLSKPTYLLFLVLFYMGFLLTEVTLICFGLNIRLFQTFLQEYLIAGALLLFASSLFVFSKMVFPQNY